MEKITTTVMKSLKSLLATAYNYLLLHSMDELIIYIVLAAICLFLVITAVHFFLPFLGIGGVLLVTYLLYR